MTPLYLRVWAHGEPLDDGLDEVLEEVPVIVGLVVGVVLPDTLWLVHDEGQVHPAITAYEGEIGGWLYCVFFLAFYLYLKKVNIQNSGFPLAAV